MAYFPDPSPPLRFGNCFHSAPDLGGPVTNLSESHQTATPLLPSQIPDSQPETYGVSRDHTEGDNHQRSRYPQLDITGYFLDFDGDFTDYRDKGTPSTFFDDEEAGFDFSSDISGDTESIPWEELTRPKTPPGLDTHWPLRYPELFVNSCLRLEYPRYHFGPETMDGSNTQLATQPYNDPRRQGTPQTLSDQDEADVLCVLYPSSGPAIQAVDLISKATPQHILQNHRQGEIVDGDTMDDDEYVSGPVSRDIALRMSSKVRDPRLGFVFGKLPERCDLIIGDTSATGHQKMSNCHFRIFVNQNGVLMLEDTSTNGTMVDKNLLLGKKNPVIERNYPSHQTLVNGSIVELPVMVKDMESVRFIVKFPDRSQGQEQYEINLTEYLNRIHQAERHAEIAAGVQVGGPLNHPRVPFFAAQKKATSTHKQSILAAGTKKFNYGSKWDGGDKYDVKEAIGKGAFALVYQLSRKADGELYACKEIEKRRLIKDGVLSKSFHYEIDIMRKLQHPNIVKYIEYHETPERIYIIMELVRLGDLTNYTSQGIPMHEYMCQRMAAQIIDAVDYLHKQHITHRDIKPDNILLELEDPEPVFKLSDFGLSKIVDDNETFLKSFCGTLLYCAPEVYPGYQRAKLGLHPSKRVRPWEPPANTHPYQPTVDVWSIGTVLYHLLCAKAPFTGNAHNNGEAMLLDIMDNPVDWEPLEQNGVSRCGIEFVSRMIVVEPAERANEKELLAHPWVAGLDTTAGGDDVEATTEESGVEEAASQLSLADRPAREQQDFGYGTDDGREMKRSKYRQVWEPDLAEETYRQIWGASQLQPQRPDTNRAADGNRLFGEIGSSALRSSGVLGQNAQAALEMDMDEDVDDFSSVEGGSYINPHYSAQFGHPNVNTSTTEQPLQYPQFLPRPLHIRAAPSLFGAEALVGQMNMASPESGVSGPSNDSKPASPKTPASRDFSPPLSASNRSSNAVKSPATVLTPRRSMNVRQGSSPYTTTPTAQIRQSSHSLHAGPAIEGLVGQSASHQTAQSSSFESHNDAQHISGGLLGTGSLLPTTYNSQSSEPSVAHDAIASQASHESHASEASPHTSLHPKNPSTAPTPAPALTHPSQPQSTTATAPNPTETPILIGKLTPTPDSIPSLPILLTRHQTSFGRDPTLTFVHPDRLDTRVPKIAIDIQMWYRGIAADLTSSSQPEPQTSSPQTPCPNPTTQLALRPWHTHPSLTPIISTRTNHYIKVNNVHLTRGDGCWLYGKLRTGDRVTVFGPPYGVEVPEGKGRERLEFECEIFVGEGREKRGKGERFEVLRDGKGDDGRGKGKGKGKGKENEDKGKGKEGKGQEKEKEGKGKEKEKGNEDSSAAKRKGKGKEKELAR